jgi:hypothetical protein
MEGISDLKIEGIDENRAPSAKHAQYINLYFRLNHKAPEPWCFMFNDLMAKHPSKPKLIPTEGLYIETWVQNGEQIAPHLELLKTAVKECSKAYIEKLERDRRASSAQTGEKVEDNSPQARLNRIIASLNFDDDQAKS